jgi:hypothetical protein
VGTKIGRMPDGRFIVAHSVRIRGTPAEVERLLKNTASQDGVACVIALPQDPAQAGKAQAAHLLKHLAGFRARFGVKNAFRKGIEVDGGFGRSHIYLDTGQTDDRDELKLPLGNGTNAMSKAKVGKGSPKRIRVIEPVWTYPSRYNATDPLKPDWYKPSSWFVQGKEVHSTRLLTFIGREVPDLLKPAYSFGGNWRDCLQL